MSNDKAATEATEALLRACCEALDDRKAEEIQVLYLGPASSVADYFIIVSGTSHPHLRALRNTLHATLKDHDVNTAGRIDRETDSGWLVVDAENILIHLFTPDMRNFYQLERLWRDAEDRTHRFLAIPASN